MKTRPFTRGAPPWWPAGEPWPPQPRRFRTQDRVRARFFRRIAGAAAAIFLLAVAGLSWAAWIVAARFGVPGSATAIAVLVVVFAGGIVLTGLFGAMQRFALPLGEVMEAADHVADGDYSVRVTEYGPPPIRALAHSFNTMTERLQHADRLRRDLMADVAHELRTPLTVLQGRLEGLRDGVYPRDDRHVAQALEETHILTRLIEDLRTLALTEAGALPLHKERSNAVGLVQDAARSMHREAAQKGVVLHVAATSDEVVVDLDPLRIREVLTNLLSNAIRHTPAGGAVTVAVSNGEGEVRIVVRDTGEGMAPEEAARIFDRFYKGSGSGGSGLGLTIAKGIVAAHGGAISAASEAGKGTSVTLTLPIQ